MGLFNIFKNKKANTIQEDNLDLETIVKKAATEPAYRPSLYKRLLSDSLFVIVQDNGMSDGEHTLKKDTQVGIVSYPDGKIPIFTSTQRIFDKGIIKEEIKYLAMKGEELFKITKGATLVLNPYSDYGKELLPVEVEKMISGTILTDRAKNLTLKVDTKVQIGQPAKYPTEIVNSLKELFSNRPNVKAAYLGWIYNPSLGDPPHLIFGLDADGDFKTLTQEAGFTAQQHLVEGEFADFVQMDIGSGISDYLKGTTPFYKK